MCLSFAISGRHLTRQRMILRPTWLADSIALPKSVRFLLVPSSPLYSTSIVLGVPYDPSLDIWSIGCTLYELYTGKILFPGRSNNQMLLLMMELKGRFNSKMIKKAKFGNLYFDEMGGFESVEVDRISGAVSSSFRSYLTPLFICQKQTVMRKVHLSKPTRDLRARLMPPASVKMGDEESKMLVNFIDLLDKCLTLDPARRITAREALGHAFVRG